MTIRSRIALLSLCLIGLAGCSSAPRNVDAKVALVEKSQLVSAELVPSRYWPILDQANQKEFSTDLYKVTLEPPYFSALGTYCRQLNFLKNNAFLGSRIACVEPTSSNTKRWFFSQSILLEDTTVTLK